MSLIMSLLSFVTKRITFEGLCHFILAFINDIDDIIKEANAIIIDQISFEAICMAKEKSVWTVLLTRMRSSKMRTDRCRVSSEFRGGSMSGAGGVVSVRRRGLFPDGSLCLPWREETLVDRQTPVKTLPSLAGGYNTPAVKQFIPVCFVLSQSDGKYSYSCLWVAL